MLGGEQRLVVVSNRLPVSIEREGTVTKLKPSSGGLVTALMPVMTRQNGLWIGWPGSGHEPGLEEVFAEYGRLRSYGLSPVWLDQQEVDQYYFGFSNEVLWPLFHDLLGYSRFKHENWLAYVRVNQKFAEAVVPRLTHDDFVWIHDYQLLLVAQYLRLMGVRQRLSFFLHIPFPSPDLLRRLPWKQEIIQGLLDYDLLGFQTDRDARNFIRCVRMMIPAAGAFRHKNVTVLKFNDRAVRVGVFPISIDFKEFEEQASRREVGVSSTNLHRSTPVKQLMLGIDRLDYTKGIPERLVAFERALEKYPELQGNITLIQVVVPSRTLVPDYQDLKGTLDALTGRINGRFTVNGWVPIHYLYRNLDGNQLAAHYRGCEIALITPLRDGMNLVAKEYCASSIDNNGVLVLSEFAGAADRLARGALVVNPYDTERTADAIYQAYMMPADERRHRMRWLRTEIRRNDVHRWVRSFLAAAS